MKTITPQLFKLKAFIRKGVLAFFFCSLLYFSLEAQKTFSPGSVILLNGDTLNGLVAELNFNNRYQRCEFKTSAKAKTDIYLPSQIQGFFIDDRLFFASKTLAPGDDEPLQVLLINYLLGEMSLWEYEQKLFLETQEDGLIEVPAKPGLDETDAEKLERGQKRLQWNQFVIDKKSECPALSSFFNKREQSRYKEKELLDFVITYNECKLSAYQLFTGKEPLVEFEIGPSISFSHTNIVFSNATSFSLRFLENTDLTSSDLEFGFTVIARSARFFSSFALFWEPYVRRYNFNKEIFFEDPPQSDQIYNDFNMSWWGTGMTTGVKYTIPNIKPQISLQSGLRLDFLLDAELSVYEEQVRIINDVNYATRTELNLAAQPAQSQLGWSSQLSVKNNIRNSSNCWEASVGYILGQGILNNDELTPINQPLNITSRTNTFFFKASLLW